MAIPVLWRTKKARYSLQGGVCPECERLVFPPRQLCPYCGEPSHMIQEKVEAACAEQDEFSFPLFRAFDTISMQAAGDD